MVFLNDIDPQFLKSINYLHSSDTIAKGDLVPLQFYLEEAIKSKVGVSKDLSSIVSQSIIQKEIPEFKAFAAIEESKASSSDNDLELDLFPEDLMCIVCNGMDVGARNRLLECSDCHQLYHQECHNPIVTNQDSFDSWVCQACKDATKKKQSPESLSPAILSLGSSSLPLALPSLTTPLTFEKVSSSASSSSSTSSTKSHSSHRHSNSSSYKSGSSSKGDKYSKSSSKGTKSSGSSGSNSGGSRSAVTPTINIITADKRIQIMKKKAAKQQEKRKHLSRS